MILVMVLAMAGHAACRRHRRALWAFAAFVLTLLPVSIIPGNRCSFYVYAPQLFLLLAVALIIDDVLKLSVRNERNRWFALVATAALVLTSVVSFQRGPYFADRVSWTLGVRRVSAVTARSL
jgi:dolichyl-phosphate-mannose--protein O-mannosyl transferase